MASTVESRRAAPIAPGRAATPGERSGQPAVWWAAIGVFFCGLALYVQGSWILGGDAKTVHTGVTPVPEYMKIGAVTQEILFGLAIPCLFYWLVVRPKRRDGRISLEGLLFLAFFSVWWQDPLYNYLTTGFTYNATFLNLGGWASHIPGWSSPNGQKFAEPLIWDLSFYVVVSVIGVILGSRFMHWALGRWPRLTVGRLLLVMAIGAMLGDFAMEFFWVRIGSYAYAGTIRSLTIFPSRFYRFPLYEPLLAMPLFLGWIALYHFRNDKGQTLVERGVDKVHVGERSKTWIRFFALAGALNLIFLLLNNVWVNVFQIHIDAWPTTLQQRSYFTHGMCGQGTSYPCGASDIAIPRSGATIHVGPNGELVVPAGATLPRVVPLSSK
jgi:hypothetical protein